MKKKQDSGRISKPDFWLLPSCMLCTITRDLRSRLWEEPIISSSTIVCRSWSVNSETSTRHILPESRSVISWTPKRRFSPVPNSDLSRDFKFSSSTPSSRSSPGMRLISLNLEEANAHTLSSCPTRREPLISYQAFSSVCSSLRSLPTRILQMSERLRFRFTW